MTLSFKASLNLLHSVSPFQLSIAKSVIVNFLALHSSVNVPYEYALLPIVFPHLIVSYVFIFTFISFRKFIAWSDKRGTIHWDFSWVDSILLIDAIFVVAS